MFLAGPLHRMCEVRFKYQSILCEFVSDKSWLPQFGSRKSRGRLWVACAKSMGNQLIKLGECVNRLCSPGASTSDMPAQLCVARDGVSFHMTDQPLLCPEKPCQ